MLSWAIAFLVIAIVAALFGFSGIAGTAVNIAWILAVIGIIAAIAFFVLGRRPSATYRTAYASGRPLLCLVCWQFGPRLGDALWAGDLI